MILWKPIYDKQKVLGLILLWQIPTIAFSSIQNAPQQFHLYGAREGGKGKKPILPEQRK
jgi:hypothetical protein